MNISKGIIVHGLMEVDGIEDLDPIAVLQKSIPTLINNTTFRKRFVNTENDNSL